MLASAYADPAAADVARRLANDGFAKLSGAFDAPVLRAALVGAAAIFVSYEGFQLLTYEYDEIRDAKRVFTPILASSAIFVVLVYIAVTLGGTMLAGALTVVEHVPTQGLVPRNFKLVPGAGDEYDVPIFLAGDPLHVAVFASGAVCLRHSGTDHGWSDAQCRGVCLVATGPGNAGISDIVRGHTRLRPRDGAGLPG